MEDASLDLVTGGLGFIGSHLVDALLAAGRRVRVVDNLATGRRENLSRHHGNHRLEIIEADVADRAAMGRAARGAERIFHLAALADVVPSIERPAAYFDANVGGTLAALEAARGAGVGRFVYAASSSCYGIPTAYPTPETAPLRPRYPYALTKHLGEEMVLHWARVYGLPAVSARLFNVYGRRARSSGAYGAMFGVFLAQLIAGKPLTVVGDGTQTRDFTFVSDVVAALLAVAAAAPAGEVYNVGTGREVSVNRIVDLLGASAVVHVPKRPGEPDRTLADVSKIDNGLGWRPQVAIEEGVAIMLANLDDWRQAPVWTAEDIKLSTAAWFRYLGPAPLDAVE